MPSRRSKDDTWKEKELLDAIKGSDQTKKKSSSSRSKESGESSGHRARGDRKDREKERESKDESRESRKARKENGDRKERDDGSEPRKSRKHEEAKDDGTDKDHSRDLERERRKRRKEEEAERGKAVDESSSGKRSDREKRKGTDTVREKDRDRDKDRAKDKDRDRDKDRAKDKDRDRDKDRAKDRDRARDKDRDRDKDKERERDRGKKKDKEERKGSERSKEIEDYDGERKADYKDREKSHKTSSRDSKSRSKSSKDRHGEVKEKKSEKSTVHEKERSKHKDKPETEKKHRSKKSSEGKRETREKVEEKTRSDEEDILEEEFKRKSSITLRKSSILQAEEIKDEEIADNYDYADDDFEDYDDDFEDDDDGDDDNNDDEEEPSDIVLNLSNAELEGVDEIRKAIREENQLAESHNSSRSSSRPSTKDGNTAPFDASISKPAMQVQHHGKIDFIAAKQKQITDKIANKTRQRGKELSKLIELDVVAVDLFELKPMNIYEVYMKSFGKSNTDQVSVQTNEDDLDQEIQTDEIEMEEKWCQFSNDIQTCGGGDEKAAISKQEHNFVMTGDTRRFNKFLGKASQVCLTLLDEMASKIGQSISKYQEQTKTRFSDGFTKFNAQHPMIQNRDFVDINISPVQTNLLLTTYGPNRDTGMMSQDGLVCVWNSNHPSEPQKFLSCESRPTCCCFSPAKPSFAFAGMDDGSITVWDLRESTSMHRSITLGKHEFTLRSSTFSTAGVYGYENHHSPVVSIIAVMSPDDSASAFQESRDGTGYERTLESFKVDLPFFGELAFMEKSFDNNKGMSFQIASMEENGTINIWVVIEIINPDQGGSENDLGLIPGGKIKIIKSGFVDPQMPKRSVSFPMKSGFTAKVLHNDLENANTFYVGTDQGEVIHTNRFGDSVVPRSYHVGSEDFPVTITAVDHSPWKLPYLLVSCEDGSVMLFNTKQASPIEVWPSFSKGASIISVQWSRSKPSVFCALDDKSFFYVWNLLENRRGPIVKEHLSKSQASTVRFSLANDLGALGLSFTKRNPALVILYSDGCIHVYKLNASLSEAAPGEVDQVRSCLEEFS